jgi:hypothetical protein
MIPDPAPPYELGASALLRERIERMLIRAAERGIRPAIERSLNQILEHLTMNPRGWGDPVRNLRKAQQIEYHGRHDRFLAIYTVHDRVPMVFLWRLIPQDGHPLFGEDLDVP